MRYHEDKDVTKEYKQAYADGFERLIAQRQMEAEAVREEYAKGIFEDQEKYRDDLKTLLGWPLVGHAAQELPKVTAQKLSNEDGYSVWRMQFEILESLTMTGLFFRMDTEEARPLVIVQHGGQGSPEEISGVFGGTANYNDMLQRVIRHGVHAFAPQLLLWSEEYYGIARDRDPIDVRLKRLGSSVAAVEIYGNTRILDYFESQSYISKFGMVGLSYGGFYTLFTAAIDTRIQSAISCAFFNKRDAVPWCSWTWFDMAGKFDDAEVACLVYPRRLCIEIGIRDDLFDYRWGVESFEKVKQLSREVGTDWVELITFDGVHEFCKDDGPIEKLIKDIL